MKEKISLDALRNFLAPVALDSKNIQSALTHPSFAAEQKGSAAIGDNQRLEFLGDAVLQWLSTVYLYKNFPDRGEGWMTQRRSLLVSREALHELALSIGLPNAMRLGKSEERDGGRMRVSTISDAMEAVVGAIFLEIGNEQICQWAQRELYDFWSQRLQGADVSNPKGKLQEYLQQQGLEVPNYEVVSMSGPDHARHFEVRVISQGVELGRGSGSSKKEAEVEAARAAVQSFLLQNKLKQ